MRNSILIYFSAIAVLQCHKQQVHTQKRTSKSIKLQKPIWQRSLEKTIEDLRQGLGRTTEFQKSDNPSSRLKTRIKKIFKKTGTKTADPNYQQIVVEYIPNNNNMF